MEPVVKQGSFVMTNKTELILAYGEYKMVNSVVKKILCNTYINLTPQDLI